MRQQKHGKPSVSGEALWRFSLAFYARPAVAEALIALQDRGGCDVNLILFGLWRGLAHGHRLDNAELRVAEAAVAGRNDPQTGQAIVAFVTLKGGKDGSPEMLKELREHVGKVIGKFAAPANIVFTPELPKTRSGKIMRRLLRDVAENRELGDTTTLADSAVVEELAKRGREEAKTEE